MKTFISVLLSLAMAISGFFGNIFAKPKEPYISTTQPSVTEYYVPNEEDIKLFNAVNEAREASGKEPLRLDPELCRLSYIRAQEQLFEKGHTRPDGTRFITVFTENNYKCNKAGENICIIGDSSTYSPQKVTELWLNSQSHKDIMIREYWQKTGISVFFNNGKVYCVQLFVC